MTDRLADKTAMGAVDLLVRDLDLVTAFYADGVGLDVLGQGPDRVTLGRGATAIVRLTRDADLPAFSRGSAGLFHTAILFEDRPGLAAALQGAVRHSPTSYTGAADHLVSEAFYLDDPEGNGVELYVDRPREQWTRSADGGVVMATDPLDPRAFLTAHLPGRAETDGGRPGADIGHVHLQVGDIPTAEAFYRDLLGFDVMARYGTQALFVSAGGYHHHLGLNTWNSRGAGPRAASLGLGRLAIEVPTGDDLDALAARLRTAGREHRREDVTLLLADPWQTQIAVTASQP